MRRRARLLVLLAASAAALAGAAPPRPAVVRVGPERPGGAYAERFPEAKAVLLSRINEERRASGATPLAYDLLGARVGDDFCLQAATAGSIGHWDTDGRAPYLRWALAGGVDSHAQNFASETRVGYPFKEPPAEVLLTVHARFMAETPPADGHRRTVLDPRWTHVGIGLAIVGGELRMTEEYSQRVAEWVEMPSAPLAAGSAAEVTVQLPKGWSTAAVDVAFEPPPRPLSLREIRSRGAYSYPPSIRTLRPIPPSGMRWADGSAGSFRSRPGAPFTVRFPLDAGPGAYYLLVYAGPGEVVGKKLLPVAAPMVRAE